MICSSFGWYLYDCLKNQQYQAITEDIIEINDYRRHTAGMASFLIVLGDDEHADAVTGRNRIVVLLVWGMGSCEQVAIDRGGSSNFFLRRGAMGDQTQVRESRASFLFTTSCVFTV